MIDPKSLRIGNTVNCLYHNNDSPDPVKFNVPVTISGIGEHHLTLTTGQREEIESFSGIPLSEQELIRLGFKRHKASGYSGADMWSGMDGWSFGNETEWLFRGPAHDLVLVGYFNTRIQYVHRLQNIFYELRGTELTYKVENETISHEQPGKRVGGNIRTNWRLG